MDDALRPDNRYFPKDQKFRSSRVGRLVRFEIGSPRVRPALATASSIISDTKLFGDVWVEAKVRSPAGGALP